MGRKSQKFWGNSKMTYSFQYYQGVNVIPELSTEQELLDLDSISFWGRVVPAIFEINSLKKIIKVTYSTIDSSRVMAFIHDKNKCEKTIKNLVDAEGDGRFVIDTQGGVALFNLDTERELQYPTVYLRWSPAYTDKVYVVATTRSEHDESYVTKFMKIGEDYRRLPEMMSFRNFTRRFSKPNDPKDYGIQMLYRLCIGTFGGGGTGSPDIGLLKRFADFSLYRRTLDDLTTELGELSAPSDISLEEILTDLDELKGDVWLPVRPSAMLSNLVKKKIRVGYYNPDKKEVQLHLADIWGEAYLDSTADTLTKALSPVKVLLVNGEN